MKLSRIVESFTGNNEEVTPEQVKELVENYGKIDFEGLDAKFGIDREKVQSVLRRSAFIGIDKDFYDKVSAFVKN